MAATPSPKQGALPPMPEFVPYGDIGNRPNIIVDGAPLPSTVLTLSHWPNNATPNPLKRDTSTATVFAYLDHPEYHIDVSSVSNNHFDEDGLFSMFALCRPDVALDHRELLVDASMAGDFGVCKQRDAARLCFTVELFASDTVSPLPAATFAGCERQRIAALYQEMLSRLPALLTGLDELEPFWREQDEHLDESEAWLDAGDVTIEEIADSDMAVVRIPDGLERRTLRRYLRPEQAVIHPFAVNSRTAANRIVTLQGNCRQLEYRYESWLQLATRRPLFRADLAGLCDELNNLETAPGHWRCDAVTEIVPRLYLEGTRDSGIPEEEFITRLRRYLAKAPPAWDPYDWKGG